MKAGFVLAGLAVASAALWSTGALTAFAWWAQGQQRELQATLAAQMTALRDGSAPALWGLVGLCAAYGFLHALGPGHGKAMVAGAAVGTRATVGRMAALAVAGSLAQAAVAIGLVYGGFAILEASARDMVAGAERMLAPAANLAVALLGIWLIVGGLRRVARARRSATAPDHRMARSGDEWVDADCAAGCGRHHGPTLRRATEARSLGAALALVAAIAARPCAGAIVVLVLAWRYDVTGAGAAAVVAMGLGAAALTASVAWLSVAGCDAALLAAGEARGPGLLEPGLRIVAGALLLASGLLFGGPPTAS